MIFSIIDYKLNNLNSVVAACHKVNIRTNIISCPEKILKSDAIIIPGIGSFGQAMKILKDIRLFEAIKNFKKSGKPIFGICLGMQLFFQKSYENGIHDGFGFIEGEVKKFDSKNGIVPNIGWNKIKVKNSKSLFYKRFNNKFFYFIHSYYCLPKNKKIISSTNNLGSFKYCSSLKFENIEAFQFHPEKSGKSGLLVYESLKNSVKRN